MQSRKDELKELLIQLDAYFVMLAEKEPKKLLERYASYQQIQEAIEDVKGKSLSILCKQIIEDMHEKGYGRQAYSSLLKELSLVQIKERTDLLAAHQELEEDRQDAFLTAIAGVKTSLRFYVGILTDQVGYQLIGEPLPSDNKVDTKLSGEKMAITNQLLRVFDDENSTVNDYAAAVVKAEADHKQALTGSFNKEQRLGGFIKTAKDLLKQYFPAVYAEAKSANITKANIKEEKSDQKVELELKEALQTLDNYFVMLARAEPKKLMSRYGDYIELHNTILADLKGGDGADLTKGDPLIYGFVLGVVIGKCASIAEEYSGKGGREAYSKALTNLRGILKGFEDTNPEDGFKLLQKVQRELDAEKKQLFKDAVTDLLKKIDEKYIPKVGKELKAEGFFAKRINKDVSRAKLNIAGDLSDALEAIVTAPKNKSKGKGKAKDKSTSSLIDKVFEDKIRALGDAVLAAEQGNKEAIKGENAREGRLGGLITSAKGLLEQYYPAYYALCKENFGKEQEFRVEPL